MNEFTNSFTADQGCELCRVLPALRQVLKPPLALDNTVDKMLTYLYRPYLLSTSDDRTVKIWDYTTKTLIATLEGHQNNVSFACYHPELPIIISGSEDGTVRLWHANTYRYEQSLNYGESSFSQLRELALMRCRSGASMVCGTSKGEGRFWL